MALSRLKSINLFIFEFNFCFSTFIFSINLSDEFSVITLLILFINFSTISPLSLHNILYASKKQFSIIVSLIALHFGHSVFPLLTNFIQCQTDASFLVPEFQFLLVKTVPQNPQ